MIVFFVNSIVPSFRVGSSRVYTHLHMLQFPLRRLAWIKSWGRILIITIILIFPLVRNSFNALVIIIVAGMWSITADCLSNGDYHTHRNIGTRNNNFRNKWDQYSKFPRGIGVPQRVAINIGVGINPAPQPNRIALDISARRRIVISEVVVVGICFLIKILSGEAQVESVSARASRILVRHVVAERINIIPLPYHVTGSIRYHSRRVQLIGVDIVHFRLCGGRAGIDRTRTVVERSLGAAIFHRDEVPFPVQQARRCRNRERMLAVAESPIEQPLIERRCGNRRDQRAAVVDVHIDRLRPLVGVPRPTRDRTAVRNVMVAVVIRRRHARRDTRQRDRRAVEIGLGSAVLHRHDMHLTVDQARRCRNRERMPAVAESPIVLLVLLGSGLVFCHGKKQDLTPHPQPTLEVIRKLARALSVSADALVFEQDERDPTDELRLQFEAVSQLPPEEQSVVKEVLDSLIIKYQTRRWDTARTVAAPAKKATTGKRQASTAHR